MPSQPNTQEVISSALSLSADDRLAVMDAIHISLANPSIDHGPEEDSRVVQAAWKDEIARRLDEVDRDVGSAVRTVE